MDIMCVHTLMDAHEWISPHGCPCVDIHARKSMNGYPYLAIHTWTHIYGYLLSVYGYPCTDIHAWIYIHTRKSIHVEYNYNINSNVK